MKLATFLAQRAGASHSHASGVTPAGQPDARSGAQAIGVVDTRSGRILDLAHAATVIDKRSEPAFRDMLALIDGGDAALDYARNLAASWPDAASLPIAGTRLLAPLPEPRQIRDCMVFEEHVLNSAKRSKERTGVERTIEKVWYAQPIYYKANRFSVVGHDTVVQWPAYSQWMDFECEMAAVIGKRGKDIAADASAMAHIFGYTIFNDLSARDTQYNEMGGRLGPAKGKDFDGGNVMGPWIVTSDEIGDPHTLDMAARVNGERWGGGNSSKMHHKWPAILAHISNAETIHPGEVIGSGTVGTGCGMEVGRKLQSGDVVELEIERIGVLRCTVVRA